MSAPLGASGPRFGSRRALLVLGAGVLLAAGVVLLIGRAAGYTRVLDGLREAAPQWLAVCLAAEALSYAGYVVAFRAFLSGTGGPTLTGWLSARVVFASLGGTRLSPAGAGGLAVMYWAMRRLGFGGRASAVRVLGLNTLIYAVFGLGAWLAALEVAVRGRCVSRDHRDVARSRRILRRGSDLGDGAGAGREAGAGRGPLVAAGVRHGSRRYGSRAQVPSPA